MIDSADEYGMLVPDYLLSNIICIVQCSKCAAIGLAGYIKSPHLIMLLLIVLQFTHFYSSNNVSAVRSTKP